MKVTLTKMIVLAMFFTSKKPKLKKKDMHCVKMLKPSLDDDLGLSEEEKPEKKSMFNLSKIQSHP